MRRTLRRRTLALVVCISLACWVGTQVRGAAALRARWGPTAGVLVAAADLVSGDVPTRAQVRRVDWPEALVPVGALDELAEGTALRHPVPEGQVLVASQFAAPGRGPWAAQLATDEAAVRVPLATPHSGIAPGDRVDVVAPGPWTGDADPFGGSDPMASAERVARSARVLEVEPDGAVLAVPSSAATATAAAGLGGVVTLVVRP